MAIGIVWRRALRGLLLVLLFCHTQALTVPASDISMESNICSKTKNGSTCITESDVEKRSVSRRPHVIVSTILEPPYMMLKENSAYLAGSERFEGYLADILRQVALNVGFEYEIRLSRDGKYGERKLNGEWDGIIGEITSGVADIAAAAIAVTDELREFVDFTEPFLSLRSSAVLQRPSASNNHSNLNHRYFSRPITTSEQLFHSNIPYGVVAGSLTHRILSTSPDPMIKRAWNRMKQFSPSTFVRTIHEGVDRIRREQYAFIVDTPMAEFVSGRQPCDLYATEPFLDVMRYAFAVKKRVNSQPSSREKRQKETDDKNEFLNERFENGRGKADNDDLQIHKAGVSSRNISTIEIEFPHEIQAKQQLRKRILKRTRNPDSRQRQQTVSKKKFRFARASISCQKFLDLDNAKNNSSINETVNPEETSSVASHIHNEVKAAKRLDNSTHFLYRIKRNQISGRRNRERISGRIQKESDDDQNDEHEKNSRTDREREVGSLSNRPRGSDSRDKETSDFTGEAEAARGQEDFNQGEDDSVSNLKEKINRELLRMTHSGELQEMYLRWWKDDCSSLAYARLREKDSVRKDMGRSKTTPTVHRRYAASYDKSSAALFHSPHTRPSRPILVYIIILSANIFVNVIERNAPI